MRQDVQGKRASSERLLPHCPTARVCLVSPSHCTVRTATVASGATCQLSDLTAGLRPDSLDSLSAGTMAAHIKSSDASSETCPTLSQPALNAPAPASLQAPLRGSEAQRAVCEGPDSLLGDTALHTELYLEPLVEIWCEGDVDETTDQQRVPKASSSGGAGKRAARRAGQAVRQLLGSGADLARGLQWGASPLPFMTPSLGLIL
ncbi:hypothetical protein V8C86DRAFT_648934 [Haematococcus lacustris]